MINAYGDLPLVDDFPGQLNQVFMNILAHAINVFDEAAQQSTAADLEVKSQQIIIQTATLTGQHAVKIRIHDNGEGMTEAVKAKIFDHLFMTKDAGKGTGLGLAIARQIVPEKHEGTINVNSAIGKGTEFVIELPIHA